MKQQYGAITYESKIDELLQGFRQNLVVLDAYEQFKLMVISNLEYAIYVEFGTKHMAPRAMIRNSMPAIKAYISQQFEKELSGHIGKPTFQKRFFAWRAGMIQYALDVIRDNTPRSNIEIKPYQDPVHLQDSWTIGLDEGHGITESVGNEITEVTRDLTPGVRTATTGFRGRPLNRGKRSGKRGHIGESE